MTTFIGNVTATFDTLGNGLTIFTTAPLSYFTALGFTAVVIAVAKAVVPAKKKGGKRR